MRDGNIAVNQPQSKHSYRNLWHQRMSEASFDDDRSNNPSFNDNRSKTTSDDDRSNRPTSNNAQGGQINFTNWPDPDEQSSLQQLASKARSSR